MKIVQSTIFPSSIITSQRIEPELLKGAVPGFCEDSPDSTLIAAFIPRENASRKVPQEIIYLRNGNFIDQWNQSLRTSDEMLRIPSSEEIERIETGRAFYFDGRIVIAVMGLFRKLAWEYLSPGWIQNCVDNAPNPEIVGKASAPESNSEDPQDFIRKHFTFTILEKSEGKGGYWKYRYRLDYQGKTGKHSLLRDSSTTAKMLQPEHQFAELEDTLQQLLNCSAMVRGYSEDLTGFTDWARDFYGDPKVSIEGALADWKSHWEADAFRVAIDLPDEIEDYIFG